MNGIPAAVRVAVVRARVVAKEERRSSSQAVGPSRAARAAYWETAVVQMDMACLSSRMDYMRSGKTKK